MTVHFVATNWDRAMGRFVGPVALFDRAREFMPELKAIGTHSWEWRGWVDLVEGSGALTPALRWRVPDLALARLWADHDGCEPDGEASSDAAAEAVATLRRWRRAEALWGRAGHTAQDLHPLDDPRDGAAAFIEDPFAVPWSPRTYDPVMVAHRGIGHPYADDHGCVPLFRGWQALLLIELFLSEPRVFAGLDRVALAERWPDLTPGPTTWWPWCFANGFAKHQAALDALSWHATYVNHALMLAEQSSPDPGMFASLAPAVGGRGGEFVIRGPALVALRDAETGVARESLRRHAVDEEGMLAAASWLGHAAVRRREAGHAKASRGYAELMREAVELMMNLGPSLDEVKTRLRDGAKHLEELFPVWLDRTRRNLRRQFLAVASEFGDWPTDPCFVPFDQVRVDEFVEWLEQSGLFAAHYSVPAIMDYGQRPDRDAEVGVAMHVVSLAAWLEHVCNEILGAGWAGGNTLEHKLPCCWSRHPKAATFRRAWAARAVPKGSFAARIAHGLAAKPVDRMDWMARDARLAQLIRNEGLHGGLSAFSRREAHDAACILLRTAMGVWLVGK